jgi:hypothetical protein
MPSSSRQRWLRLEIDPVIERAEQLSRLVARELPEHSGLIRAAAGVAGSAREARRVTRALRRWCGLHRLPAFFLVVALLLFAAWIYWRFLHVSTLRIAVPEEDAVELQQRLSHVGGVEFRLVRTDGSRENLQLLDSRAVDVAFVQGGIPLPNRLPRLKQPESEVALYFVREGVEHSHRVRRIMTSAEGQGSHSVAAAFAQSWKIDDVIEFSHEWRLFRRDSRYRIPDEIDAVFVVKDLGERDTLDAVQRLAAAGFRLTSLDLGVHATTMDYLQRTEIPPGYLSQNPPVPDRPLATYLVATYLVAREDLPPRLLAAAAHLLDRDTDTFTERVFEPTLSDAADALQGLEAFLSVLIYIGLTFLTLLGVEVLTYRRRFNELNTLVSLISMHQSDKDVLGITDDRLRRENLLYLSLCSDLLGLISVISGYYGQENPSLLYGKFLEIIHQRCDGLKLNIQIKILHASVAVGELVPDAGMNADTSGNQSS